MKHEEYQELLEMIYKELRKITKAGELTEASLKNMEMLTHSLKSIKCAMKDDGEGYSMAYPMRGWPMFPQNYSEDDYMKARRRDSRDRYMSTDYARGDYRYDDRYPRHGERDAMMSKLGRMVDDAQDEQTRRVLRDTMRALGE